MSAIVIAAAELHAAASRRKPGARGVDYHGEEVWYTDVLQEANGKRYFTECCYADEPCERHAANEAES